MFLIEMVYFDYIYGDIHPEESFYLQQASNRLVKVLSPSNQFINDPLKLSPKWTTKDVLAVIKKLANPRGVIYTLMKYVLKLQKKV